MCIQFLNRSLILERGSEYMIHFPHFSDYKKISRSNIWKKNIQAQKIAQQKKLSIEKLKKLNSINQFYPK